MCGWLRRALAVALGLMLSSAMAHDTWFALRGQPSGQNLFVALGTGNAFPVFEHAVDAQHLQHLGCSAAGRPVTLTPVAKGATALLLRARLPAGAAATCWAQLWPSQLQLADDLVQVYMDEARPPPRVLSAWADLRARGLPWNERYTKHARIVFGNAASGTAAPAAAPAPAAVPGLDIGPALPMGMDMVFVQPDGPLRPGHATVQVLRDGLPLPGLAVELRHLDSVAGGSPGLWLQTDAQGQVRLPLPLPGQWLLRGIDIRLSDTVPDRWDSRFATLAFDVTP